MYDILPESCSEGKIKDYGLSGDIIRLSVSKSNEHTWLIACNKAADSFEIVDGSVDVGIKQHIRRLRGPCSLKQISIMR